MPPTILETLQSGYGFSDPAIVLGQSTCAWEILTQVPAIRTLVAPIGGGGICVNIGVGEARGQPPHLVGAPHPKPPLPVVRPPI